MYQILIIIVILLIYYTATIRQSAGERSLFGYFVAENDQFCDESGINSMMIFIGERINNSRDCYIVVLDDIANQSFTFNHSRGWAGPYNTTYNVYGSVIFEGDNVLEWPEQLCFSVDIITGVLTISDNEKIYARLNKQNEITNDARD